MDGSGPELPLTSRSRSAQVPTSDSFITLTRALRALALGLLLSARAAAAVEESPAHLTVTRATGAESCPDALTLATEVNRLNGETALDGSGRSASRTRLFVEIVYGLDGYRAMIRAQGARSGERALSDVGPDCKNLGDALALTLAIVLDNFRDEPSIDPKSRERKPLEPVAEDDPGNDSSNATSLDLSPPDFEAGAGLGLGFVRGLEPLAFADSELWLGSQVSLSLGARLVFPNDLVLARGGARVSLVSGALRPCFMPLGTRDGHRLGVCVAGLLGPMIAEGRGFDETKSSTLLWGAISAGLTGSGPILASLHWSARAMAHTVPRPLTFTVEGTDESYETPRGGLFAGAGLRMVLQ